MLQKSAQFTLLDLRDHQWLPNFEIRKLHQPILETLPTEIHAEGEVRSSGYPEIAASFRNLKADSKLARCRCEGFFATSVREKPAIFPLWVI